MGRANAFSASMSALYQLYQQAGVVWRFKKEIRFVGQIKSFGQLEIQLDGCTLMFSTQCIFNLDIDLGAVKGTVTFFQIPGGAKAIQRISELFLSLVPGLAWNL